MSYSPTWLFLFGVSLFSLQSKGSFSFHQAWNEAIGKHYSARLPSCSFFPLISLAKCFLGLCISWSQYRPLEKSVPSLLGWPCRRYFIPFHLQFSWFGRPYSIHRTAFAQIKYSYWPGMVWTALPYFCLPSISIKERLKKTKLLNSPRGLRFGYAHSILLSSPDGQYASWLKGFINGANTRQTRLQGPAGLRNCIRHLRISAWLHTADWHPLQTPKTLLSWEIAARTFQRISFWSGDHLAANWWR